MFFLKANVSKENRYGLDNLFSTPIKSTTGTHITYRQPDYSPRTRRKQRISK